MYYLFAFGILNCHVLVSFSSKVSRSYDYKDKGLPEGLKFQSPKEMNYLKFHKCKDTGEVYSAAYIITKAHLFAQFTSFNLSYVNCEMGSFIMMNQKFDLKNDEANGVIIQSLDLLDFSVIHLSAYERLQRRYFYRLKLAELNSGDLNPILHSASILKERLNSIPIDKTKLLNQQLRTIAIMPFLGSDMGAGHSVLGNRLLYLKTCFWSIYPVFPHIVAMVKSKEDRHYAMNVSGLPFYDVIHLQNLPKSAALPVATVMETKARLQDGRWDFDYIYFTESDQILMVRIIEDIFTHLQQFPRRFIAPHRLMPYPPLVQKHYNKSASHMEDHNHWMNRSCCLPRQNCVERASWVHIKHPSVELMNVFGLQIALGNSNFHLEEYRTCRMQNITDYITNSSRHFCP